MSPSRTPYFPNVETAPLHQIFGDYIVEPGGDHCNAQTGSVQPGVQFLRQALISSDRELGARALGRIPAWQVYYVAAGSVTRLQAHEPPQDGQRSNA